MDNYIQIKSSLYLRHKSVRERENKAKVQKVFKKRQCLLDSIHILIQI